MKGLTNSSSMDRYKIGSPSLGVIGLALIININTIIRKIDGKEYKEERKGSEKDVKNMKKLFEYLNFDVEVKEDLTRNDIVKAILDFCTKLENNSADISAVIVMAHGGDGDIIWGSDERPANIKKDILDRFSNENCRSMIEKPKFFVFQSCRGNETDQGMRGMSAPGASTAMDGIEENKIASVLDDAIIAYATIPDYVAWRNKSNGSHFLNAMCDVFMEHAHDTEIQTLFKLVSKKMKDIQVFEEERVKDAGIEKIKVTECRTTSEVKYRISKDLYFQPIIDQACITEEKEKYDKQEDTSHNVTHQQKCCIIL